MQRWVNCLLLSSLTIFFLCIQACNAPKQTATSTPAVDISTIEKPRNVILLIGDGMGLPQITGAMYMNGNKTVFERFKNIGFQKTHSSDNLVTDSAAGATAFASGVKTYNGAIGVNAQKKPVPTILEMAETKGMATGLVVTSSITHATPAAFIAHVADRGNDEEIALGFLTTPVDIFIGGGMNAFTQRKDGRNLVNELKGKNYDILDVGQVPIEDLNIATKKNIGYFTSNEEPLSVTEGRDYAIVASKKAIDFLDERSPQGFFMMIEGSQIDWGGHDNDANYVVTELLEFEKVVAEALDFAERDKTTLVIVTADHETGGFAVMPGSKLGKIEVAFTTKSHTATMIPVFAAGPGSELFRGIYENTEIFYKMKGLLELQ